MKYAVRVRNAALVDQAAPLLIGNSLADMVKLFEPAMVPSWLDYYERWKAVARDALNFASQRKISEIVIQMVTKERPTIRSSELQSINIRQCRDCTAPSDNLTISILSKLGRGVQSLQNLDDTFDVKACCDTSKSDILSWRSGVESAIKELPTFSSLVSNWSE
ncbi:hypothetical protein H0H81_011403 [Sphagnurus paluster]|uniref:Uncharacterized protein n=1 Tax=Sphagnurus paluster TaxID=117069 RepID=A0A9P7K3Q9_9AGAR|nr:hypothetical protein H0H81_011403 [Sphagnurus paluster]